MIQLRRRDLLAASAAALLPCPAWASQDVGERLRREARALARRPYGPRAVALPGALADLDYDGYRDLRFKPAKALWRDLGLPFEAQMFHRGGLFREPVELVELADGQARPIAYDAALFTGTEGLGPLPADLGFAGFRLHGAINRPDYLDEICAFLGASYFRAVGRGDGYGLSARGLALGAGEDGREEFPHFTRFLLERPAKDAATVQVHALLDSPSVAGAYRFDVAAGQPTTMAVAMSLFPRRPIANVGIAPLTSMYLFANEQPRRFDDFRPEVHDSDGLAVAMADGTRLWRPLINPKQAQVTAVAAERLAGFGLMQRQRAFSAYEDLEANYHRRPGAWVAPVEGFGAGEVRLVELPAHTEFQDNIVASWRPAAPLRPGREHRFVYRLDWGREPEGQPGRARAWREGAAGADARRFVVDFGPAPADAVPRVAADKGEVAQVIRLPNGDGVRIGFELRPGRAEAVELTAGLWLGEQPVSETWTYRWLA